MVGFVALSTIRQASIRRGTVEGRTPRGPQTTREHHHASPPPHQWSLMQAASQCGHYDVYTCIAQSKMSHFQSADLKLLAQKVTPVIFTQIFACACKSLNVSSNKYTTRQPRPELLQKPRRKLQQMRATTIGKQQQQGRHENESNDKRRAATEGKSLQRESHDIGSNDKKDSNDKRRECHDNSEATTKAKPPRQKENVDKSKATAKQKQ